MKFTKIVIFHVISIAICLGLILLIFYMVSPEPPMPDHDLCTMTKKGYCANECYENNKLIPCENFTYDEHFCDLGICEASGGCPDYFEMLEGKTIEDCIKEVIEKEELKKSSENKPFRNNKK